MYDTPTELLQEIAAGEDSYLELKELVFEGRQGKKIVVGGEGQAPLWLARQLSGFLNAEGGVLVLGVRDDGIVAGIDTDRLDDVQAFVVNVARNNLEPPGDHLLSLDAMPLPAADGERFVVKVDVRPDFYAVHAPKGQRPYRRTGNTTQEVSMELLPRLLARRAVLPPAEERPVLAASKADLAWDLIEEYHERRFRRSPDDATRFARNLKLVADDELGDEHPTVAGLLLFGVAPQDHLPFSRIDVVTYDSLEPDTDRRLDARVFTGTVLEQIEGVTDYFARSPHMAIASRKTGSGRKDFPAYSSRALQEAVVNAVAHRDYGLAGAQIRVQIFLDRVEVTSPGRLPNSLIPEDLFAGAQPVRRNQVLVGFLADRWLTFSETALMEGMGEGFLTIVRESERLSDRTPELRQHTEAVTVTMFSAAPTFSEASFRD